MTAARPKKRAKPRPTKKAASGRARAKSGRFQSKHAAARPTNLAAIAKAKGLTERTLQRYVQAGWDGRASSLDGWRTSSRKRSGPAPLRPRVDRPDPERGTGNGQDLDEKHWTLTYRRAKALREMLELQLRRGELVPKDQVETLFVARVAEARAAFVGLPRQVARRLSNQGSDVIETELAAEIRAILERLARGDPVLQGRTKKKRKRRG